MHKAPGAAPARAGRVKGLPRHLEVTPVVSGGMILFFGIAALA
jgi:hypothetical protein